MENELTARAERLYTRMAGLSKEAKSMEKEILPGSESALNQVLQRFEKGKARYLDLADVRQSLLDRQVELIELKIELLKTKAGIESLIGAALETL
jgi:cobalt-zinc-cadmium efflux system outer membrane protein